MEQTHECVYTPVCVHVYVCTFMCVLMCVYTHCFKSTENRKSSLRPCTLPTAHHLSISPRKLDMSALPETGVTD